MKKHEVVVQVKEDQWSWLQPRGKPVLHDLKLTRSSGGELQQMVWHITKAVDPTRPALETSGWIHTLPHPEVRDAHDYTSDPARLRAQSP